MGVRLFELDAMRSRNRVDSLFPALRHGQLCDDCHARPAIVHGRCETCDERRAIELADLDGNDEL